MDRVLARPVASVTTALAVIAACAIAFVGADVRATPVRGDQHAHRYSHPQLPLGLESFAAPPEAGTMLRGPATIRHFQGGRGAKRVRGTGVGRTIYTGVTAFEPTMGIDKKGNIFYQGAELPTPHPFPIVVVSRDGGRSWDEVTPQTHALTQDPFLYVDARTGRTFTADLQDPACATVSHTDDVGRSWTTSEACGLNDHQNISAGPPVTSPTVGYPNVVYMCAVDAGLGTYSTVSACLKSLDGGITWVRTGSPAYTADPRHEQGNFGIPGLCGGTTGHGYVDSKGTLYLPSGWCGQPYLAISKDEGATWERIQVADNGMPGIEGGEFEHEAAVAVDATGNIYYFWTARNRLPYLAVSRDEGKSFSKPMMVGPPGLKEAWGPTMDVGATGKIALAYIGSTNAPGGKSPTGRGPLYKTVTWNGYITTSIDALSNKPRFFTASVNRASDPLMRGECGAVRCGVQYDFIDVVIDPDGRPWTAMVDGCPAPGGPCGDPLGAGVVGTVIGGHRLR
ncbi:MAG: sialidase family protein [Actinomycetota bacterium]